MESLINNEVQISNKILEVASNISPLLGEYNAGIFGGVAVWAYSAGRRTMHDLDILCPAETIDDLSKSVADYLDSTIELSPVGYDLSIKTNNIKFNIDIMTCNQTDGGLVLPFKVTTDLPLRYQWCNFGGNTLLVVSKEILQVMKSSSLRNKDISDLQKISR